MAYIIGYVNAEEKKVLLDRGWDIEPASKYNLVGDDYDKLIGTPPNGEEAVVIFVDSSVFNVMSGPDWEK